MNLNDLYDRFDARITRTEDKFEERIQRLEDKYDAAIATVHMEVKPIVEGRASLKFMVAVVGGLSTVVGAVWGAAKYLS